MRVWLWMAIIIGLLLGRQGFASDDAPLRRTPTSPVPTLRFSTVKAQLLTEGQAALAARLALVAQAQSQIDMQYYVYHDDHSGRQLARALLAAANRGIKIRILLDAIHGRDDDIAAALNQHPNIEIRRFNPFRWRQLRLLESVLAFNRLNRRMHNKQMIVDGVRAIVGGRNIGDEYFGLDDKNSFADLDVMISGKVATDLEKVFGVYWKNKRSKSIHRLSAEGHRKLEHLEVLLAKTQESDDALIKPSELPSKNAGDHSYQCPATVVADRPDQKEEGEGESNVVDNLSQYLDFSLQDIQLISAYFVPGAEGVAALKAAQMRGVTVRVLTNSLASTDVPAVHGGYSRYRKALLQNGVQLWEMKPEATPKERHHFSLRKSSQASLHTKAYVFDRRFLFIGSFNLDPRSAVLNTEMGLLLDCPAMAADFLTELDVLLPDMAWQIKLSPQGALEWWDHEDERQQRYIQEPQASFWRRSKVWWIMKLPIEGNL